MNADTYVLDRALSALKLHLVQAVIEGVRAFKFHPHEMGLLIEFDPPAPAHLVEQLDPISDPVEEEAAPMVDL